jgi:holo-[acyl-carrier protein] synthase
MVYGIGIDIVRTARIKEVVEKWGKRFIERVYTKNEIVYCYQKHSPYLSLAVRFAAKEAFIKAMGSEITMSLKEIEVINMESGKPVIKLNVKLEHYLTNKLISNIHLSMSHEHDYAVACVVLEQ